MKKFQDKEGGWWEISLTIGNIFRVKDVSQCRFDLFEPTKPVDGVPLGQLLDDRGQGPLPGQCHGDDE